MKIKLLVWYKNSEEAERWQRERTDDEGKQQHEHACCRVETQQQHLPTPQLGAK